MHGTDTTIRVIQFNGTDWIPVGSPVPYYAPLGSVGETDLTVDTAGKLYYGYSNFYLGDAIGKIMTFDGTDWVEVGNTSFMQASVRISLRIGADNSLYAAYYTGLGTQARVSRWDGMAWDTVGTAFTNLVNIDIAPDGSLYVLHSSGGQIALSKLVNGAWVQQGTTNIYLANDYPEELKIDDAGVPYVCYSDANSSFELSMKKYDGTNWVQAGFGFSGRPARDSRMAFGGGRLFVTYGNTMGVADLQVYCMYYGAPFTTSVAGADTAKQPFSIYPNPLTTDRLTIETPATTNTIISITDITGKELLRLHPTSPKTEVDLSGLSAGIYLVRCSDGIESNTVKLVKQ